LLEARREKEGDCLSLIAYCELEKVRMEREIGVIAWSGCKNKEGEP